MWLLAAAGRKFKADAYKNAVTPDAPLAWYRFDNRTNITLNSGSTSTPLTAVGSPTYADSLTVFTPGRSAALNGSSQGFSSVNSALRITGNLTVTAMVSLAALPVDGDVFAIAVQGDTGETEATNYLWYLNIGNTGGVYSIRAFHEYSTGINESVVSAGVSLSINTPYHVAMVRDTAAKTYTFYLNGAQVGSPVSYTNNPTGGTTTSTWVGYNGELSTRWFNGKLDEVAVFNTALSAARVLAHSNAALIVAGLYTKLLMRMDGSFTDATGKVGTNVGTPTIVGTTPPAPYTTQCGLFGTGNAVSFADSDDWNFGTGDFSIQMWMRPTSTDIASGLAAFLATRSGPGIVFAMQSGKVSMWESGTWYLDTGSSGNTALVADTNYHLMFCRTGTTMYFFINGVLTCTVGVPVTFPDVPAALTVGGSPSFGQHFLGRMNDLRIDKGICLYSSSFTPPSAALPVI